MLLLYSVLRPIHTGFLDDIRDHTDRTPTDDEIAVAREYLALLETATREDHVKSTDVCDTHHNHARALHTSHALIIHCDYRRSYLRFRLNSLLGHEL